MGKKSKRHAGPRSGPGTRGSQARAPGVDAGAWAVEAGHPGVQGPRTRGSSKQAGMGGGHPGLVARAPGRAGLLPAAGPGTRGQLAGHPGGHRQRQQGAGHPGPSWLGTWGAQGFSFFTLLFHSFALPSLFSLRLLCGCLGLHTILFMIDRDT